MAVTSPDKKAKGISNADNKDKEIAKQEQDQLETVVTAADNKGKLNIDKIKGEEIGQGCQQQNGSKMAVTPATNGNKEEKIGKTCHQCRQKITGLSAHCNNKKKDKTCPNKFCHKCLRNRYGEQAEEMSVLTDWNCPKCRGICNCSVCMKKRGHQPTGILTHTAKSTGFSSVSEMLRVQGPKARVITNSPKVADKDPDNNVPLNNEPSDGFPSKSEKENSVGVDNSQPLPSGPIEKKKKRKRAEFNDFEEISLPKGTELTTVAGIELPPGDVGQALQFLEFCTDFKEVLDLKEREPEYILEDLIRGGNGCRGKHSLVIRFHIVLLSMIQKDFENKSPALTYKSGKDSWLHALQDCSSRSRGLWEKLKLNEFNLEADEYESLSPSTRLRLLNFLCDELLCTEKLRKFIDNKNSKVAENVKVSKDRVQAAKQKENKLKMKMQDEIARAVTANNGVPVSASEHDALVSEIKTEISQAHAEVSEAKNMISYDEQNSNAARTEPFISDIKGRRYWQLKGYSDGSSLFLQDIGGWDGAECIENWFTLDAEQMKEAEERVLSLRKRKVTSQKLIFT